ncbi:MAG: hypothetical protein MUD10_05125 [Candidatus Pacebacteria bacterium]|jgi:hypothetical protein|nr:hypothetical protein [Candidatus Paceibacterota bacterium]
MEFTDKSTLAEVLEFSESEEILAKFDVPCLGCPMAKMEMQDLTLGRICAMYGIDQEKLLADLNAAAERYDNDTKKN